MESICRVFVDQLLPSHYFGKLFALYDLSFLLILLCYNLNTLSSNSRYIQEAKTEGPEN